MDARYLHRVQNARGGPFVGTLYIYTDGLASHVSAAAVTQRWTSRRFLSALASLLLAFAVISSLLLLCTSLFSLSFAAAAAAAWLAGTSLQACREQPSCAFCIPAYDYTREREGEHCTYARERVQNAAVSFLRIGSFVALALFLSPRASAAFLWMLQRYLYTHSLSCLVTFRALIIHYAAPCETGLV